MSIFSEERKQEYFDSLDPQTQAALRQIFDQLVEVNHSTMAVRDAINASVPAYVHDTIYVPAGNLKGVNSPISGNDVIYTCILWENRGAATVTISLSPWDNITVSSVSGQYQDLAFIIQDRHQVTVTLETESNNSVTIHLFGRAIPLGGNRLS